MSKTKRNRIEMNNAELDLEKIKVGDVVAIEWLDVHAYERIRLDEIRDLEEPGATRCWGAVVRVSGNYIFIAHEIGDNDADGVWIEALPYGMIRSCNIIGCVEVELKQ
jgi:hypothetical protein